MAYDETSFLNGLILGKAMKGVGMADPNRGDHLRVQSGRLTAVRKTVTRPEALPPVLGGSAAVESFLWRIHGQLVESSAAVPGEQGCAGITAAAVLTDVSERFSAAAAVTGGLTDGIGAALRQKAPDRRLTVPGTPEGLGGTLLAAAEITTA